MGSVVTARVVQPESAGAGEECRGGTGRLPTGMVGLLGTADSAGAGDGMTNAGVEIAAGGPWRRALTCATWEVLCSPSRQPCTRAACCKGKVRRWGYVYKKATRAMRVLKEKGSPGRKNTKWHGRWPQPTAPRSAKVYLQFYWSCSWYVFRRNGHNMIQLFAVAPRWTLRYIHNTGEHTTGTVLL